jgi:hypothetical protein
MLSELHQHMVNTFTEVKMSMESVFTFLGMEIDISKPGVAILTQVGYIKSMLEQYKVTRKAITPARDDLFDIDAASPLLCSAKKSEFYSVVYKLMYIGKRTRPDILLPAIFLTTHTHSPTEQDNRKLYRILEYLNHAPYVPLVLNVGDSLQLYSYMDASHAVHKDMKGHSGMVLQLGNATIYCRSSKQKLNSKSSTESELVAISDGLPMTIWTYNFIEAQEGHCEPVILLQDNQSTLTMIERGQHIGESTRHINIRYFFIHHWIMSEIVDAHYCPTLYMWADLLTKPLSGLLFIRMVLHIMGELKKP